MARQSLSNSLWAAVFAVLLQLFAPILALSMLVPQPLDPFAEMPLCSDDMGGGGKSMPSPHHGWVCPLCQFAGHAGQLILPSPAGIVAPAKVGWVRRLPHSIAEPRAPPSVFAQARAPPPSF
jgi:hypothetical protein